MNQIQQSIYLIDMDGVLADLEGYFVHIWKEKHPDLPVIPQSERTTFYLADQYPVEHMAFVNQILQSQGFYRKISPVEREIDAIKQLKQQGNRVKITTTPRLDNPYCIQDKLEWVFEHLGKEWVADMIVITDKTFVLADYLIDDKPEVTGLIPPHWEHILFDQPYNRQTQGRKRIKSLAELL